jgi:hypothetical protein
MPKVGLKDDNYVSIHPVGAIKPVDRGVKPILDHLFGEELKPESESFHRQRLSTFVSVCPFSASYYHRLQNMTSPPSRHAFSFLQELLGGEDGDPPSFCKKKCSTGGMDWMSMYKHSEDRAGYRLDSDDDHDWSELEMGHTALLTYLQNILGRITLSDRDIRRPKALRVTAIAISLMGQGSVHLSTDLTKQFCVAAFLELGMVDY